MQKGSMVKTGKGKESSLEQRSRRPEVGGERLQGQRRKEGRRGRRGEDGVERREVWREESS